MHKFRDLFRIRIDGIIAAVFLFSVSVVMGGVVLGSADATQISGRAPQAQVLGVTTSVQLAATATDPVGPYYTLVVTKAGTGAGTVTSNVGGISCGTACQKSILGGTTVTLTATPSVGSVLSGWTGCTPIVNAAVVGTLAVDNTCTVSVSGNKTVTATFTSAAITPTVTTNPASSVGASSATLNGMVNPNGIAATGYFRYGTTSTSCAMLPTATPSTSLGSGTAPIAFNKVLSGLSPSTTYYYCAVALNSAGMVYGSLATFTTATALPIYPMQVSVSNSYPNGQQFQRGSTGVTVAAFGLGNPVGNQTGYIQSMRLLCQGCAVTDVYPSDLKNMKAYIMGTQVGTVAAYSAPYFDITVDPGFGIPPDAVRVMDIKADIADSTFASNVNFYVELRSMVVKTSTGQSIMVGGLPLYPTQRNTILPGSIGTYVLSVTKNGTGSGTIYDGKGPEGWVGINCGSVCQGSYASGTQVQITAVPAGNSTFAGWQGCSSTTTSPTCTVTMTANLSISATFGGPGTSPIVAQLDGLTPLAAQLTKGQVAAPFTTLKFMNPSAAPIGLTSLGIIADNAAALNNLSLVTLTDDNPDPATKLNFVGSLQGSPVGNPQFSASLTSPWVIPAYSSRRLYIKADVRSDAPGGSMKLGVYGFMVGPTFTELNPIIYGYAMTVPGSSSSYSLTVSGSNGTAGGTGRVVSLPAGIDISWENGMPTGTQTGAFVAGTTVTLTAIPAAGYGFSSWGGVCAGHSAVCTVTMTSANMGASVTFAPSTTMQPGGLYKMVGNETIYYLANDNKRYVFPYIADWLDGKKIFASWGYVDSDVKTVSSTEIASYPLGANVTVRPGTYLIQRTMDGGHANVYAVTYPNVLRLVPVDQLPVLYGTNWANRILKMPEPFFANYTIGAPLTNVYPDGTLIAYNLSVSGFDYLVYGGKALKITSPAAFAANRFGGTNIMRLPLESQISYPPGVDINGLVACLVDPSQTTPCTFISESQLNIITPHGGEQWLVGRSYTVGWGTANIPSTHRSYRPWLDVLDSNNNPVYSVQSTETAVGGDDSRFGRMTFTVPNSLMGDYRIRISIIPPGGSTTNPPQGISGSVHIGQSNIIRPCTGAVKAVRHAALGNNTYGNLGLDISAHPEIVWYRIQWFSGGWSGRYIPGADDVDWKTNLDGSKRRVWGYFGDHNYEVGECVPMFRIGEISPFASSYPAGSDITFKVRGIEPDGSPTAADEGLTAAGQVYTTNSNPHDPTLYSTQTSYDPTTGWWTTTVPAPNASGSYLMRVVIWCGFDTGKACSDRYGSGGPQVEQMVSFTVSGTATAPRVSNVVVHQDVSPYHHARITWDTDVPTTTHVMWGLEPDINALTFTTRDEALRTTHGADLTSLLSGRKYYYKLEGRDSANRYYSTRVASFQTASEDISATEAALQERIKQLEYKVSELERQVVETEKSLTQQVDAKLTQKLAGKILLQVDGNGEAWYVDKDSSKRFYLKDGTTAYTALQAFGLGITNANLTKLPVGVDERIKSVDSDSDGLDDTLEISLGTNPQLKDSDSDGYDDATEVSTSNNPLGQGKAAVDAKLAQKLEGKILLQVENAGQAWYIAGGKRYYMKDGEAAYKLMRYKSLGITNSDLRKIGVGEFEAAE